MKRKAEMTVDVVNLAEVINAQEIRAKRQSEQLDAVVQRLDQISVKFDVIVNLLLDLLPDERFAQPRKLTHKVARLDATGIELKPFEAGRMLGRPSKDIASRRREIGAQKHRAVKGNAGSTDSSTEG
jgi:hypothetical protein